MDLSLDKLLAERANLERILDSLMEGIIAHDKERRILYFNREAERITGYTRNDVVGRDCHQVFGRTWDAAHSTRRSGTSAYKIRRLAEAERDVHVKKGWWRS
jgi:PAS domain S-box-containing protein